MEGDFQAKHKSLHGIRFPKLNNKKPSKYRQWHEMVPSFNAKGVFRSMNFKLQEEIINFLGTFSNYMCHPEMGAHAMGVSPDPE